MRLVKDNSIPFTTKHDEKESRKANVLLKKRTGILSFELCTKRSISCKYDVIFQYAELKLAFRRAIKGKNFKRVFFDVTIQLIQPLIQKTQGHNNESSIYSLSKTC
jgi:hypothetical protein